MSREIKFRAWDKDMSTMFYDDIRPKEWGWPDKWEPSLNVCLQLTQESHDLMQFTGLKDNNGLEIYEGDIVEHVVPEIGWCEVIFTRGRFTAHGVRGVSAGNHPIAASGWKVIGNIYENSELLESVA